MPIKAQSESGPAMALPPPEPPGSPDRFAGMVGIQEETIRRAVTPLFSGAVVFYLGVQDNHYLSRPGQVSITRRAGREDHREAIEEGRQSYDFSTHDSRGELITERLGPESLPAHLRGRPWTACEHAEHLRYFFLMRDPVSRRALYFVLLRPEHQTGFTDYVTRTTARLRRRDQEVESIIKAV